VLLLGLIGIVGLLLLAYSFKLTLVFLAVLGASLLTRVPLRKLLLGLQRGKQKSGVVNTFWGSTTLFLVSVFSLIAFIYFEEELPKITALEILVSITLLIAVISFLVGLFVLVFLRSKTGFPRWTVALAVFLGLAGLMVPAFFIQGALLPGPPPAPPRDAFDVLYRAKITFRGKVLEVQEEYEIQPKSHYLLVSIDDEWLSRTPSVSIGPLHLFEAKESAGAQTGLLVTVHREIEADITGLGLLRQKLEISDWDLRVRVKNLTKTPQPWEEADSKAGIYTFALRFISTVSGKLEVRLPKNSYLGSFPEGKLVKLPDRDQFVLDFSNRRPDLELYYLAWLRFSIVRTFFSDSSLPDIALKTIAFIFWPAVLLALGATQRSLGDSLVKAIQRKPQRRRAGF
jgi:hypothetical protein